MTVSACRSWFVLLFALAGGCGEYTPEPDGQDVNAEEELSESDLGRKEQALASWYAFISEVNNQCLQVTSATFAGAATMGTCTLNNSQRWVLQPTSSSGYYRLKNVATGLCLQPFENKNYSSLVVMYCTDSSLQRWRLSDVGRTMISNLGSGYCIAPYVTPDGTYGPRVIQSNCQWPATFWYPYY